MFIFLEKTKRRIFGHARALLSKRRTTGTYLSDNVLTGHIYLDRGNVKRAMNAYVLATHEHPDHKLHAGQYLYDYVSRERPGYSDLRTIVDNLRECNDFNVPDLFAILIRETVQYDEFQTHELRDLARGCGWAKTSDMGSELLGDGAHAAAMRAYNLAAELAPNNIGLRLQMGITEFLAGKYEEAEKHWAQTELIRDSERRRWGLDDNSTRILGPTWFPAIGHVAFIDTHLKATALGWRGDEQPKIVFDQSAPPVGMALIQRFAKHVDVHGCTGDLTDIECNIIGFKGEENENRHYHNLRRETLTSEFWYGRDRDGRVRWYAPLGAQVECAWKAEGREPLLNIDAEEHAAARQGLAQMFGLPEDAWFVCLHMREPGFHADWHKKHPGTRHVDIATYDAVIDYVTQAGGWVVRLGDRSMTPLRPRDKLIDYAVDSLRNFELDVLLCGMCTYFIGTNSGLSLLPPLFGRRCVLTNWSPVAIPNWYLDDIYIPKLVRNVKEDRYLTFAEMYNSMAGWTQWQRDYKDDDLKIEDNSPDDLVDAVAELHDEIFNGRQLQAEERAMVTQFNEIAVAGGSYVGSRIGTRFLKKHPELLGLSS